MNNVKNIEKITRCFYLHSLAGISFSSLRLNILLMKCLLTGTFYLNLLQKDEFHFHRDDAEIQV